MTITFRVRAALQLLCHLVVFCATALSTPFEAQFHRITKTATRAELYEFFWEMPKGGILNVHSEYAVPPEFWFNAAVAESGQQGDEYYTRMQTRSCPGEVATPILFVTVRRSHWERLSPCEKQNFKPLATLSSEERRLWMEALIVTSDQGASKVL
ncbi:MAG: hypothetical protein JO108_04990 [Acidobacteriaceae bacterium]|nr:hypothetical protein [Acidobacteriaceae bacterium]